MSLRLNHGLFGLTALSAFVLIAACTSSTPTPAPTVTPEATPPSPLASCGGPFEHIGTDPLVAVYPQNDGYLWVLPDGTDANVTFADILAADDNATETSSLSMPIWGAPMVSPDHLRSAVVVFKRQFGSSPDTNPMIVLSDANEPVTGLFEVELENPNPLIRVSWLPESGCLAALIFSPGIEQGLVIVRPDGTVAAEFQPKMARGEVLEVTPDGWIALDRTHWVDGPEIELFNVRNPGTTVIVPTGDPVPDFVGLTSNGETAAEFATRLRERSVTLN